VLTTTAGDLDLTISKVGAEGSSPPYWNTADGSTNGYSNWLGSSDRQVMVAAGQVAFDPLAFRGLDSSLYVWPWTNPYLSVLLRTNDSGGLILSPEVVGQPVPAPPDVVPIRFYKSRSYF